MYVYHITIMFGYVTQNGFESEVIQNLWLVKAISYFVGTWMQELAARMTTLTHFFVPSPIKLYPMKKILKVHDNQQTFQWTHKEDNSLIFVLVYV